MFYERLHVTFVGVVAMLVDSVVVAEFAGYWLHRLLHTDKFPGLSRGHLNRFSLGNVGIRWLAPYAIIVLFCWAVLVLLGVPPVCQALALSTLVGWPLLMFNYLHERMHVDNPWMTRNPQVRPWFLDARRFDDIHHPSVGDKGFMELRYRLRFF